MKARSDFVTNSSSTSYMIEVFQDDLTADEFVKTLYAYGIGGCIIDYWSGEGIAQQDIINSLRQNYESFPLSRGEHNLIFGDEQGTLAGKVFDYCLRDGFHTPLFRLWFHEHLR